MAAWNVGDFLTTQIAASETRLTTQIAASEARLAAQITENQVQIAELRQYIVDHLGDHANPR